MARRAFDVVVAGSALLGQGWVYVAAFAIQLAVLAAAIAGRVVRVRPLLVARYYVLTTASMAEGYLAMLERQAGLFGDLIRLVAQDEHHAVVIHCTAGKDRTGLGAALLLGAVGVGDDVIVEDYALTDQYRSQHRLAEMAPRIEAQGLKLDDLKVLFTAPAETMANTLGHVTARWGGIEGYLIGPAQVAAATLDALREAFVE